MHQIYYMDATHPIWQLPQVLQAPGQRDSKLSGSGTALAGLESTLRRSWPAAQNAGKKAPFSPLSSLLPLDRRTIGSLLSMGEEALHWELCWSSSPPSTRKKFSVGIKTHYKIQLILPGFPLRKLEKQRGPAVSKHFSCLKCNITAYFYYFKTTLILIFCPYCIR